MDTRNAGLCGVCRHQRVVRNSRGSSFSLCRRSVTEPAYARYPRLPVLACRGFERRTPTAAEPDVAEGG